MSDKDEDKAEADALFMEVIEGGNKVIPDLLKKAYVHNISKAMKNPNKTTECLDWCKRACEALPEDVELAKIYLQVGGK